MTPTFTLQKLNGLVVKDMATLVQLKYQISPYLVSLFKEAIREEKENFKHHFTQTAIQCENDAQLKLYIGSNQQALIDLASQLVVYTDPQKINSKAIAIDCSILCQFIYSTIEDLLGYVTKHYPKHAHSEVFVPQNYRMIMLSDIRGSIDLLEKRLTSLEVDEKIIRFALQPFESFENANVNDFTYRDIIFLRELKEELNGLLFQKPGPDRNLSDAIQWKLMQLNYNSLNFFKFWTEQIASTLNQSDLQVKMNSLRLIRKQVCQLQVKPHLAYDPSMKPLKDIVCDWLDQEVSYLQATPDHRHEPISKLEVEPGFKVRIDLSVAQIAYFFKVLIEIEILQSETVARLLNILPKFIRTSKMENVSPDSFKNRYYAPESGVKEAVRKVLVRMLDYINANPGTP